MRRCSWLVLSIAVAVGGCGGARAPQRLTAGLDALPEAPRSDLLAQARASLTDGTVSPRLRAALAASEDPAERQAARLLAALEAPAAVVPEAPEPAPGDFDEAPRIKMGTAPPPEAPVAPTKAPEARKAAAPSSSPAPAHAPRARLERVGLASTKKGASLSLRGSGGLVVGVASQPASGIVRLVMDAEASTGALQSRPRVSGARVTGIRRTGKTVFVTLALDPGWSLKGIVRTRSGARVDLTAPA